MRSSSSSINPDSPESVAQVSLGHHVVFSRSKRDNFFNTTLLRWPPWLPRCIYELHRCKVYPFILSTNINKIIVTLQNWRIMDAMFTAAVMLGHWLMQNKCHNWPVWGEVPLNVCSDPEIHCSAFPQSSSLSLHRLMLKSKVNSWCVFVCKYVRPARGSVPGGEEAGLDNTLKSESCTWISWRALQFISCFIKSLSVRRAAN